MVRAQYHFRVTNKGVLVWEVRRLIALSRDFTVHNVSVSDVAELDENHWYAIGSTMPTPRRIVEHCVLINEADMSYPIILDQNGRVMDGMHRVCKALMAGLAQVPAVQFDEDPEPDYVDPDLDSLPYDD